MCLGKFIVMEKNSSYASYTYSKSSSEACNESSF